MAQAAYFRIEHKSFNRNDWGYGRVAGAAHYAANSNKRGHVVSIGFPEFPTSYDAQREFLKIERLNTRKNAHLGDTLIVSLPKEVSEDHRKVMMERLLWSLTFEGKTYAMAWEHRDHEENPHFHVVLIDRDRETGKAVGKFGHARSYRKKQGMEPNVTEWMRKQWEDTGNAVFDEFGYDLYFDRRSNLERGLEPAGKHKGLEAGNDNDAKTAVPEEPIEPVEVETASEPDNLPSEPEDTPPGDAEMEYVAVGELQPSELSASERVQIAREAHYEARAIREAIARKELAVQRYQSAKLVAQRAAEAFSAQGIRTMASEQAYYQAKEAYQATHTESGKAKGFQLSIAGRTLWQSAGRKQALSAEQKLSGADYNRSFAKKDLEALDHQSQAEASRAQSLFEQAQAQVARLEQVYGTDDEAEKAAQSHENTVRVHLKDISLAEISVMVDEGELTLKEAAEALSLMGRDHEASLLIEQLDQSPGEGHEVT